MKIEEYEQLITEIENILNKSKDAVSPDLFKIDELIDDFREKQYRQMNEPIEFAKSICELSGCNYSELKSRKRNRELTRARQLILVCGVRVFGLTTGKSAEIVGRDHSTFHFSLEQVKNDYSTDKQYREMFSQVFNKYHKQILK